MKTASWEQLKLIKELADFLRLDYRDYKPNNKAEAIKIIDSLKKGKDPNKIEPAKDPSKVKPSIQQINYFVLLEEKVARNIPFPKTKKEATKVIKQLKKEIAEKKELSIA